MVTGQALFWLWKAVCAWIFSLGLQPDKRAS